jgi:hypothetical protein
MPACERRTRSAHGVAPMRPQCRSGFAVGVANHLQQAVDPTRMQRRIAGWLSMHLVEPVDEGLVAQATPMTPLQAFVLVVHGLFIRAPDPAHARPPALISRKCVPAPPPKPMPSLRA